MEGLNIKHFIISVCLVTWQTVACAQEAASYSLPQCIDLAMQQNQTLINANLQVKNNTAALRQSEASLLPSLSGYANQGISTGKSINPYTNAFINQEVGTGQYGLNANLVLFSGFSTLQAIRQNALACEAGKMELAQARMDVSIQVTQAYLQILSCEELMNQALSQMAASQAQLDRLQVLQAHEAVSPSLLYDTRAQLSNDKLSLIQARGALVNAKLAMSQLLNVLIPEDARFEKAEFQFDLRAREDDLAAGTLAGALPAVRATILRSSSALKKWRVSRGALFPSLSLNGALASNYSSAALSQQAVGYTEEPTGAFVNAAGTLLPVYETRNSYRSTRIGFNDQVRNNFNSYIGLSLQIPLFNGLRTRTQNVQSEIAYRQAKVQEQSTLIRYTSLLSQLINEHRNAYERYMVLLQQVSDYENSFRIASAKFENGAINSVDYIAAKNNFDKSSAALINARYECLFKSRVIDLYRRPE